MRSKTWSIVLAAGAGRRLAGLTGGVPKQFFRPSAGESLLGMTLARMPVLAEAPDDVVVLTPSDHAVAARPLFVYTWPATIGWSDLGTPERFNYWLKAGVA